MKTLEECATVEEVASIGPMELDSLRSYLSKIGDPNDVDMARRFSYARMRTGSDRAAFDYVLMQRGPYVSPLLIRIK
jgi:hypothetical protein